MKTITQLALIISLGGCFFAAEVQAVPVSGAARAAKAIFGAGEKTFAQAKRVKISPPPAPAVPTSPGSSSAAPWIYGGGRAVNEYQRNQQKQEQQRQRQGYGYPYNRY